MRRSAADLVADFASGADDPVAACERALAGAAASEAMFLSRCYERAWTEARASRDRWRAGRPLGPLDGVPVAWKDMIDLRGVPTTQGSALLRDAAPAAEDAAAVRRLATAGAVTIGKTNLSEFAFSGLGLNPHFGTPVRRDRADPARAPGGSSSGSALAVALGVVPIAIGTDTSGSVRIPAAFNGVAGFRPTQARYPRAGVASLAPSLDCVGTLATGVEDIVAVDAALTGRALPRSGEGAPLLVVPEGAWIEAIDPAVVKLYHRALARLQEADWRLTRRRSAALEAATALLSAHGPLVAYEAARTHAGHLVTAQASRIDRHVERRLRLGSQITAAAGEALCAARPALIQAFADELGDALLVTPACVIAPPLMAEVEEDDVAFDRANARALSLTMALSFVDAPGVTLPPQTLEPDPAVGILFSAAAGRDDALLSAAVRLEEALAGTGVHAAASNASRARSTAR